MKREDLFLVSKLWNSFHDQEQVEPICRKQLQDWNIDYFDLYIVHFPISLKYVDPKVRYPPGFTYDGKNVVTGNATIQETWHAMEDLVSKNLAKSIGISNFNAQLIMDLLRYAKIKPATLQIEHHPYLTQPGLIKLAHEEGIAVTAYSSFGPQSFLELNMLITQQLQAHGSAAGGNPLTPFVWVVVVVSLHKGVFHAEALRAGIEAVPRTTLEAARSLGFSRRQLLWRVELPLALRFALPSLVNNLVDLVKMTAVASAIAVGDVTYESIMIWTQRDNVLELLLLILLYFGLLTWLVSQGGRWLEQRLRMPGYGQ